jgi:hypothetical protein
MHVPGSLTDKAGKDASQASEASQFAGVALTPRSSTSLQAPQMQSGGTTSGGANTAANSANTSATSGANTAAFNANTADR